FLREHLGVQVFDRSFSLRDDGTSELGLAFPFDLEGTAKRPVDLISSGTPKTPALDQRQAALLGLPPTAHAIAGNDARAENLFVLPGTSTQTKLLNSVVDGVWIGTIDRVECFEPSRVQIRATARGVRQIRSGRLAHALPDLIWEDSLLRAFSSLVGIGAETVISRHQEGFLGGTSAPSLAISGVTNLRSI
ncbi:MAG: metallopeptidase TldD-related protein, partial [Thermoanaerobaculia bacterium]